MTNYVTFLKKELLESVRTYKLFIILAAFAILGIMNPLIAKLTPEIVSLAMPEGMNITVADPTAIDSWTQFYKNVGQFGELVIVLIFSGILSTELSKGTLIQMITKGLSRTSVILSKYTHMLLMWTIGLALSFLITWGYTVMLFPGGGLSNLVLAVFCLWLFGVFLLSVLLLAVTLVKAVYGCLLITGGVLIICMVLNMIAAIKKYNPFALAANNIGLIQGTVKVEEIYWSIRITGILTVVLITLAVGVFRKKQL